MNILENTIASLEHEEHVMLATIIAARGSSPAAVSSKLLLRNGGAVPVGTIGGGCMEGDVILRARRLFDSKSSEIVTCDLNEEDVSRGLICGGSVDILLEHLSRRDLPFLRDLRAVEEGGEDCVVATLLGATGGTSDRAITHCLPIASPVQWYKPGELPFLRHELAAGIDEAVETAFRKGAPVRITIGDATLILEPRFAEPRLLIYGGGHVGRALCRAASAAGFRVTVADDRERFANSERFPEAAATRIIDFEKAALGAEIGRGTYVAIVTRGHAFDETVLEQILRTEARYIGMIGSKKKVFTAMEHLFARGVPVEHLRRVHAPIGLEIGAVTAEEIAVSIVAQLIRVRRGAPAPSYDKSDDMRLLLQDLDSKHLIASRTA